MLVTCINIDVLVLLDALLRKCDIFPVGSVNFLYYSGQSLESWHYHKTSQLLFFIHSDLFSFLLGHLYCQ